MKNFTSFFLTALCFSCVLFFAKTVSCDDEYQKIDKIKKELLDNLQRIALAVGSDELNRVNDFVKRNALMGISQKFGAMVLEDGKCSTGVIFAPVLDIQDYNLGEEWEEFCLSGMAVQFFPHSRILAINERIKFSAKASGLAFAREAYKAYMSAPENCANYKQIDYELLEKDAQSFQNKLMDFIGGRRYRKLVYGQAEEISKEMAKPNGCILHTPKVYDKRIGVISGKKSLTPEEENFWKSSVWVHAMFIAIEKNSLLDINDSRIDVGDQKKQFLAIIMREK